MKKIYSNYFQKSKVFLYPLLGIKKGIRFVPLQTYISWGTSVPESKNKLFCLYEIDKKNKKAFNIFIEQIKENIYFESFDLVKQKDDKKLWLFTFDLRVYKTDLKHFKKGQYSKFSKITKHIIKSFFGDTGTIAEYIESYLYPGYFYDTYAEILKVPVEDLHKVGQLCDKPDMKKENFEKEAVALELFK
tara:strand:- start:1640 stop:2206 length:567 start_codon:yes stop_codon:yes gene_type:complete